ncbi:hypothetical protein QCE42_20370, partial [Caballeronia sp. LZ050]|uniref:phage baseplate assembly protein n=2 Tax=unclassified Caballeronia TaxID=2646786 RepID=UPI002858BD41|nr:hypothetical protein [Caballeronia sp. LZ050]
FSRLASKREVEHVGQLSMQISSGSGSVLRAYQQAADPGVKRYRPKFIVSEQPSSDRTYLERRVDWQIARAYGMSRQVRVLVDSWTDPSGSPWYLNYQVPVTMPLLKIPEKTLLLVTQISFILDESGTHTELLLAPRQAYLPEPLVLQRIDPDIAPA